MGIFDKAKDLINEHNEKFDQALDQAGDFVDQKTGGKYGGQIDGAVDQVQGRLDEFSGHQETAAPAEPEAEDPLAPTNPPAGA